MGEQVSLTIRFCRQIQNQLTILIVVIVRANTDTLTDCVVHEMGKGSRLRPEHHHHRIVQNGAGEIQPSPVQPTSS